MAILMVLAHQGPSKVVEMLKSSFEIVGDVLRPTPVMVAARRRGRV
jgi:molecular chaperone GrpE (heat shock protein)